MKEWFGNRSVQTKIILTFSAVLLAIACSIVLYFYQVTSSIILENSKKYIVSVMQQAAKNINLNVKAVEDVLYDISTDLMLEEMLQETNDEHEEYQQVQNSNLIRMILNSNITKNKYIKGAYLKDWQQNLFCSRNYEYSQPDFALYEKQIRQGTGKSVWLGLDYDKHVAAVGKVMYDHVNLKELGIIIVYVDLQCFEEVIQDISLTKKDEIYIHCGDQQQIGQVSEDLQNRLPDGWDRSLATQLWGIPVGNEAKQMSCTKLAPEGWVLLSLSQDERQNSQLRDLQKLTIILFLVAAAIGITLSILLARSISKPLRTLTSSMKQLSMGDFSVRVTTEYRDEIGVLRDSFNHMVDNMDRMLQTIETEQQLKQEAQLWALRMQINPHFLYNTLDTINWLANQYQMDDISQISRNLAYLMRYSLKDRKFASLEEEYDAVEHYMAIQKLRHGDSMTFEADLGEDVLYENIPPHTLLSMVENAVEHGFSEAKGVLHIEIIGKIEKDLLVIEVQDNGCGIPETILRKIQEGTLSAEEQQRHHYIGIRNVDRRLKLHFGAEYGVVVRSKLGEGTCIQITLPYGHRSDEILEEDDL